LAVTVTQFLTVATLAFVRGGVFDSHLALCRMEIDSRLFENGSTQYRGVFGTKGYIDFVLALAPLMLIDDNIAIVVSENADGRLFRDDQITVI
jgi:hypothetical protein